MDVKMADFMRRNHAAGVPDEPGRKLLFADFCEVRRVGTIVSSNDDKKVERFIQELEEGILSLLRRATNRVEKAEVRGVAVAGRDRCANAALDFLSFAAEHCRLIRDADALKINVWIKTRRVRILESSEKVALVAAIADVVTDDIRLIEVKDDEIVPFTVAAEGARSRSHRLLMGRFPMDNACNLLGSVLAHALPHAHNIAARGVHYLASTHLDGFHSGNLSAECGDDHDILSGKLLDLRIARMRWEVPDSHGGELGVYFRVVYDLAEERNATIGEDLSRGIGKVNGALNSVAKSELLGQPDDRSALLNHPSLAANALHETASIVALNLGLHA